MSLNKHLSDVYSTLLLHCQPVEAVGEVGVVGKAYTEEGPPGDDLLVTFHQVPGNLPPAEHGSDPLLPPSPP